MNKYLELWPLFLSLVGVSLFSQWASPERLEVTATAYNSVPEQTAGDPNIGAWGDPILPGMNVIAVSRDLLKRGLDRGTKVRIAGFSEEFIVMDKMAARWENKIDIYMGDDIEAARAFGKRTLEIQW